MVKILEIITIMGLTLQIEDLLPEDSEYIILPIVVSTVEVQEYHSTVDTVIILIGIVLEEEDLAPMDKNECKKSKFWKSKLLIL